MQTVEIIKAWKDAEYRDTLTDEQRDEMPEHPCGVIEVTASESEEESSFGPQPFACGSHTGSNITNNCTHQCCHKTLG